MSVIFRGNTAACIKHLAKATHDTYFEARTVIATFAGVVEPTVHRWMRHGMLPTGGPLIRLRFYLAFLGYDVEELRKLHPSVRVATECFAFGLVTVRELGKLLDYKQTTSGDTLTYCLLRGVNSTTVQKLELLALFGDEHAEELALAKKQTKRVIPDDTKTESREELETVVVAALPPTSHSRSKERTRPVKPTDRDVLIESFAGSVKALIPLAQVLVSDDVTPAERAKVRELAGGDGVFTLANALFSLCSETSRKKRA